MLLSLLIFSQFSTSREFFEISLKKKTRKVNPKFDESDRASPLKPSITVIIVILLTLHRCRFVDNYS